LVPVPNSVHLTMNLAAPNDLLLARTGPDFGSKWTGDRPAHPCPADTPSASGLRELGIAAFCLDLEAGDVVQPHRHERAHLVYACAGAARVSTPAGVWTISPREAVWLPPLAEHAIRVLGPVGLRLISIGPEPAQRCPNACVVLRISALLQAVGSQLVVADDRDAVSNRADHLDAVLLDELEASAALESRASLPAHGALRALCAAFLEEPGSRASTAEWAARFGMTHKTFARAFAREMRMTFGTWQRAARVEEASRRLCAGQSVTEIALELGYESLSAFTAMFRRVAGVPPSRIRASAGP
jgi:AraC-like DNA-binding protein